MECQKEKNLESCPCTYAECSRKGLCCECIKHHREKGALPACYFSAEAEKTYDRRIENFIKDWENIQKNKLELEKNLKKL